MKFSWCLLLLELAYVFSADVGEIQDFKPDALGETWVYLTWSVTPADLKLHKYTLVINDDLRDELQCHEVTCSENVTYLEPCSTNSFSLVAHYEGDNGKDVLGEEVFAKADTREQVPGLPTSVELKESSPHSLMIVWDPPRENSLCIASYSVCYVMVAHDDMECMTQETAMLSASVGELQACSDYHVTVAAITPSGVHGPSSDSILSTDEAAPGMAQNVEVTLTTPETVTITFDDPLENPQCVERFSISWGAAHGRHNREVALTRGDHLATVSDLKPCTNYSFDIFAISPSNLFGPAERSYALTEEDVPHPVSSITIGTSSTTSMGVSWEPPVDMACVDHYSVCHREGLHPFDVCEDVPTGLNLNVVDLLPCTTYEIQVTTVSSGGLESNNTVVSGRTMDEKPGKPQKLTVSKEDKHSIAINWEAPIENPQCAIEYDNDIVDLSITYKSRRRYHSKNRELTEEFSGLAPCSDYTIRTRARSLQGLNSAWATANATTLEDIPSEPQEFKVKHAEQKTITLTWWQPKTNKACVLQYHLEWTANDGSSSSMNIVSPFPGVPLPFEVETQVMPLTPCSAYHFQVAALTPSGEFGPMAELDTETGC